MVDNIDMDCLGPRGCQEVADGAVDRAWIQGLGCLRMRTGGRSHRGRQRGWEGRGGRPRAGAGSPPLPCASREHHGVQESKLEDALQVVRKVYVSRWEDRKYCSNGDLA